MMTENSIQLVNGSIIDANTSEPAESNILVIGDNIKELSSVRDVKLGADQIIDISNKFVLPGLWDVHTHIGKGIPDIEAMVEPISERTIRAGRNCIDALNLGITSLRVVGEKDFIDVAWKKSFSSGQFIGPSLYTCGWFITTTAGHFLKSGCTLEVDGPVGLRQAIRNQIKNGVDFIKLNLTGGVMGPSWDRMEDTFFTEDEIKAAFDICTQRGFKIVAHAGGTKGIQKAITYGAHTIEHGYQLDDSTVSQMMDSNTFLVPTLSLTHMNRGEKYADTAFEKQWMLTHPVEEDYKIRAIEAAEQHAQGFRKALSAGVKICCGSDLDLPYGGLLEMSMMVKCGMTPHQAITAATLNAAEACLVENTYGTIEPDKKADILILNKNPLDDINNIRDVHMVIKNGRILNHLL